MKAKSKKTIIIVVFLLSQTLITYGQIMKMNFDLSIFSMPHVSVPKNITIANKLNKGVMCIKIKNYNDALKFFEKAQIIKGFRKAALTNTSVTYALKNDYSRANYYLKKAVEQDGNLSEILLYNQLVMDGINNKIDFSKTDEYTKAPHSITVNGLFNKALMMSRIQDYEYSNSLFNKILSNDNIKIKIFKEAVYGVAFNYLKSNDYDSAYTIINKLNLNRLKIGNIVFLSGFVNSMSHKYDLAIKDYKKSKKLFKNNESEILNIAYSYNHIGEPESVKKHLLKIRFKKREAVNLCALGSAYLLKGNLNKSKKYYHKAINKNISYIPAYIGLGNTYLHENNFETAEYNFKRAQSFNPIDLQVLLSFAKLNFYKKDYSQANYYFDLALIYTNQDTLGLSYDELNMYGYSKLNANYFTKALSIYLIAKKLNNKKVESNLHIASLYIKNEKFEDAIQLLDQYINQIDTNSEAYFLRALAKQRLDDFPGSITDYTKAIELKCSFLFAYNNRSMAYMESGQFENALADINHVLEFSKKSEYYLNRALINNHLGNKIDSASYSETVNDYYKFAMLDYDSALSIYYNPYIFNNIGVLYYDMKDTANAILNYLIHENKFTKNNLGVIRADQERYPEALKLFEEALEIDSLYGEAIQNYKLLTDKIPGEGKKFKEFAYTYKTIKRKYQKGEYYRTYLYYLDDDFTPACPEMIKHVPEDFIAPDPLQFKEDYVLMTSDIKDKGMYPSKPKSTQKNSQFPKTKKRTHSDIKNNIPCSKMKF